jgi:hypothetical protein
MQGERTLSPGNENAGRKNGTSRASQYEGWELEIMRDIIASVFVIGVLLFYSGLAVALVVWGVGGRFRSPGKRSAEPSRQRPTLRQISHHPARY